MGATGLSAGSLALQGFSTLMQSQGVAEADTYQAEKSDTAAKYGELKAVQVGGQLTRNLNTTLGNIAAVRAAANADPSSPTGAAVIENQEAIGNEQRGITVNSILQQARQDRSDAAYLLPRGCRSRHDDRRSVRRRRHLQGLGGNQFR